MTKSVAFHSYKGGTGKTTIAANLAAYLAQNGQTVFLLDLDVYAGDRINRLVSHDVGLPEIVRPDDNVLSTELFSGFVAGCECLCHSL